MTDEDFITRLRAMATITPPIRVDHAEVLRAGNRRRAARTAGAGVLAVLALTATGTGVHALVQSPRQQASVLSSGPTPTSATPTLPALPTEPVWTPPRPRSVDGVTALVSADRPEGSPIVSWQAVVSGELVLLDGGCIGLKAGPDFPADLAVWPPGTTVLPGGEGIDLPGAGPIRLGQQIYHGGGYSNRGDGAPLPSAVERCAFTEVVSVNDVLPGDDISGPPG